MKTLLKATLVVALAVGLTVAFAPKAKAFHDDGVAHCNGCHTMHNQYEGSDMGISTHSSYDVTDPDGTRHVGEYTFEDSGGPYAHMLKGPTASDTCLGCHGAGGGGYRVLSASHMYPDEGGVGQGAGDFAFLKATNLYDGYRGHGASAPGDRAGHNLDAPTFGLDTDTTMAGTNSPGGLYPISQMGCTSCHEPHGGTQFRFLHYGANPKGSDSTYWTGVLKVAALEVPTSSWAGGGPESDTLHTAYLNGDESETEGISSWCAACHGSFHQSSNNFTHQTDQGLDGAPAGMNGGAYAGSYASIYNHYDGTGPSLVETPTVGPYLAQVPVEFDVYQPGDTPFANHINWDNPIPDNSEVVCATCHRAHASSAPSAGRWDFNTTIYAEEGQYGDSYKLRNPYESTAGDHQRSLCNKCHAKDLGDPLE